MKKESFYTLLQSTDTKGDAIVSLLQSFGKKTSDIQQYLDEYDPMQHKVMKLMYRPDDIVFVPSGEKDETGNFKLDVNGHPLLTQTTQPVTRIPIAVQKAVTETAAAILCFNKIQLVGKTDADITILTDVWDENYMDYLIGDMCAKWLSETEVAMLWYITDEGKYKVMVLANSDNERMYPVMDEKGKMIAFGREYETEDLDGTTYNLKKVRNIEIYTDKDVYIADDVSGVFQFDSPVPHGFDRIPVSYVSRLSPLWNDAQLAIERQEETISNHCDTNEYNGSPILFGQGDTLSLPAKGKRGKYIEGSTDAKLSYVTWDQLPEAIKLELDILEEIVAKTCGYVDLSLSKLKGMFGSAPSAYAIKLLFTPAHQFAARHERLFGQFIKRGINILLSALQLKADSVQPKFTYLLPKDEQQEVITIRNAVDGGFLSKETAAETSPVTQDAEKEVERLKEEAAEAAKLVQGNTGNPPMEKVA